MKIVIVGAGVVGEALCSELSQINNDVVLIEKNEGISVDSLDDNLLDYAFESLKDIEYFLNWTHSEKDNLLKNIEKIGINKENLFDDTDISIEKVKNILTSVKDIEKIIEVSNKALNLAKKNEEYSSYLKNIDKIKAFS